MALKRYSLLAAASLVLSLAVPLSYGGLDAVRGLLRAPPWLPLCVIAMVLAGWVLNALRLRLLSRGVGPPLPLRKALSTMIATEFAICATPAGAGGPLTYVYLLGREGLKTAHAAALFATEQVMDLLFFIGVLPVALLLLFTRTDLPHLSGLAAVLALVLTSGMLAVWLLLRHYRPVLLLAGRLLHRLKVSRRTRNRLARWALQFRSGVGLLLGMPRRRLFAVYVLCSGHWMLRYSVLYIVLWGLGEPIAWSYLLLAQMLSLSAGQLTFLPGGSGGVELGMSALLAPFVPSSTLASALILWRFGIHYWYLIAGAPVFLATAGSTMFRRITA